MARTPMKSKKAVTTNARIPILPLMSVLLGAFLFSAKGIMIKLAFPYGISADELQFWRQIFALPFFALIWIKTWPSARPKLQHRDLWKLPLLGFMGYYIASWLDFLGLQYVSAGLERMVIYLYPTFVLVLGFIFKKGRVELSSWLSMILAYAGILSFYTGDVDLHGELSHLGVLYCVGSALLFAIFLVVGESLVKRFGSLWYTSTCMIFATLGTSLHQIVLHGLPSIDHPLGLWLLALAIGTFGTVVPSLCLYWGISQIGAAKASITAMVGPVSTLLIGWLFLGETIGWAETFGTVLILLGVAGLSKPVKNVQN